jgi:hypothetical protein
VGDAESGANESLERFDREGGVSYEEDGAVQRARRGCHQRAVAPLMALA